MRQVRVFSVLISLLLISLILVDVNGEIDIIDIAINIVDGDTFDIESGERVRLADVNAYEPGSPRSEEAKDYLTYKIVNQTVYLDVDANRDPYDRLVCVVYVDYNTTHYQNINKELLFYDLVELTDYNNEFNPSSWTLYVSKNLTPTPIPSYPTPTPTSSIEPTPTGPPPIRFYNPYLILFGSTLLLIALGILVYFKKYRKSN